MSVLLFMPESGGNPLESIIMTSEGETNVDLATISRFELRNGKPVRKLSTDSTSLVISENSQEAPHHQHHQDDVSSLGADDNDDDDNNNNDYDASPGSSSSVSSFHPKPLTRNVSAITAHSNRTPKPHHPAIADAKQPQLRLSPVGAILGATTPAVVKAANKAQERRVLRTQSAGAAGKPWVDSVRVHKGFLV